MKNKIFIFFTALVACATLIACSLIVVKPSILFRKPSGINVKGVATQRVVSDTACWTISVETSVNFNEAQKRNAFAETSANVEKVVNFLRENGFDNSEIRSSNITLGKLFKTNKDGYNTSEVCGKTAFASVDVATKKLELLDKVMAKSAAICGDAITINSPVYLYSKIEDLKLNLLAKATENAKSRAQTLASAGGAKLGNIMSATQGVFQITAPLSTETASYGMYDTSTIEKDVRCVVNAQFEIEK